MTSNMEESDYHADATAGRQAEEDASRRTTAFHAMDVAGRSNHDEHDDAEVELGRRHKPLTPFERVGNAILPSGGALSSALTLASSTLGASTIALPGAFSVCGMGLASIFLILCAVATVFSINLLAKAHVRTGLGSYEVLARTLLGRPAEWLCGAVMVVFCFGTAVAYIIAVGELAKPLLPAQALLPAAFRGRWGLRLITFLYWSITMFPMSLKREINALRYFTLIGVAAIVYFIIVIVAHAAQSQGALRAKRLADLDFARFDNNMVVGLSLILFAFCCQPNVYEVYSELHEPRTPRRMTTIGAASMTCCTILYLVAGFFGYADFGRTVHGAVLEDYNPYTSAAIFISYICLGVKLTVAFSLNINPTRDTFLYALNLGSYHTAPDKYRWLVSGTLSVAALLLALFIPSLEVVFGFLGGLCGSTLGFILPALFVMYAGDWSRSTVSLGEYVGTWALLLVGIAAMIFGTAGSIYQAVVEGTGL